MRVVMLLAFVGFFIGCTRPVMVDREALAERYQQTAMSENTVSVPPLRLEPGQAPPVVVNWWYAGTSLGKHNFYYREITWDQALEPVGRQRWYRVLETEMSIPGAFKFTRDSTRWVPLHEADPNQFPPPPDLKALRSGPERIDIERDKPPTQPDRLPGLNG